MAQCGTTRAAFQEPPDFASAFALRASADAQPDVARAASAGGSLHPGYGCVVAPHQCPVFGIEAQGSFGASAWPFCNSSIECLSGERTNAMLPSRGGRLMVTPPAINFSQVA